MAITKKLSIIIIFMLCAISTFAQTYMIQCESVTVSNYNKYTKTWNDFGKPTENDCIITVNPEKNVVTISNGYKDAFKLIIVIEELKGKDPNDGDPYRRFVYIAIDKEGRSLRIVLTYYDSGVRTLTVVYNDIRYQYQGHLIDFNTET